MLCLAVSPDGRRLATGPSVGDKVARVWEVATGKPVSRLEGNAAAVYALAFTPDGKSVLTGGEDTTLRLYDAATGRPVRRFRPDGGARVHALAYPPDGRRVVVGSEGNLNRLLVGLGGPPPQRLRGPARGHRPRRARPPATACSPVPPTAPCVSGRSRPPTPPRTRLPTKADLAYLRTVTDDLDATTPEALEDLTELTLNETRRRRGPEPPRAVDEPGVPFDRRRAEGPGAGLVHLKSLTRLRRLDLGRSGVGNAGLAHLAPLTRLESLRLGGTKVSSAGIPQLKTLTNLKELDLEHTDVADVALMTLIDLPNLEDLNLSRTNVDDYGVSLLRAFKALKRLALHDSKVSAAALKELEEGETGPGPRRLNGCDLLARRAEGARTQCPLVHDNPLRGCPFRPPLPLRERVGVRGLPSRPRPGTPHPGPLRKGRGGQTSPRARGLSLTHGHGPGSPPPRSGRPSGATRVSDRPQFDGAEVDQGAAERPGGAGLKAAGAGREADRADHRPPVDVPRARPGDLVGQGLAAGAEREGLAGGRVVEGPVEPDLVRPARAPSNRQAGAVVGRRPVAEVPVPALEDQRIAVDLGRLAMKTSRRRGPEDGPRHGCRRTPLASAAGRRRRSGRRSGRRGRAA